MNFHRITGAICTCLSLASGAASAHHGTGLFDVDTDVEYTGTLVEMELVNPHSYMHFRTTDANGVERTMRCEMRAAMLIRRSGWTTEMFVPGSRVVIQGHPHREDPNACYLESFTLGEQEEIDRDAQFSLEGPDISNRRLRLASGEPNISGDWAVEQSVLTAPPEGGRGAMIPKSMREDYAAGRITMAEIRARNPSPRPVYTEAARAFADDFEMWSVEDNPRLSCKPTSILYDWTFDWPVNQITQTTTPEGEKVIDIYYGLYNFNRRIHLDMDSHPDNLQPSYAGHSIGHWEGDTLVVDTIGFEAGVLAPPTPNSEELHIIERFTLNNADMSLRREYEAIDPVYLAGPYAGADTVFLSDTPFVLEGCKEMTPEFIQD
jgi:hypothetical protein